MLRPFIALLATVLLLALPGAALAQSAGDDQYADPFADTEEPANGGQGGDQPVDDGSAPAPATPAPDPAPAGAEPAPTAVEAAPGATLPRTGFEVVLLIAAAFPLLVGGVALRRVAS